MTRYLRGGPDAAKVTTERLAWFVTKAPLYHQVLVPAGWSSDSAASEILPAEVTMPCATCVETANWDLKGGHEQTSGDHWLRRVSLPRLQKKHRRTLFPVGKIL